MDRIGYTGSEISKVIHDRIAALLNDPNLIPDSIPDAKALPVMIAKLTGELTRSIGDAIEANNQKILEELRAAGALK